MSNSIQAEVHTLTGAYVCDAIGPEERAAFEAHLSECEACETEVAELREVTAILGIAAAEQPSARLKQLVDARIRVTRQQPPVVSAQTSESPATTAAGRTPSPKRRSASRWAGWALAAALAGVVAGLSVHAASQQRQITSISAQATTMQQLLAAPDATTVHASASSGGQGVVVYSRSRGEAAVVLTGLPTLPSGRTYQLWLMDSGGAATARSIGLVGGSGTSNSPVLADALDSATTVGLTIEPAGGSPKPTTAPLMVVSIGT
jgi:Anti-sigma-K factor rskA/Putative zinc-finger